MANEDKKDFNAMLHDKKDMPKIQIIADQKSIEKYGGSKMYFAPPIDYDKVMKKIPYGKVITVGKIREYFAELNGADFTEPITAGVFVSIVAWASYQRSEDETPYWRTLKANGELNAKYPNGIEAQKEKLEAEGHTIIQKGRKNVRYYVKDYENSLFVLITTMNTCKSLFLDITIRGKDYLLSFNLHLYISLYPNCTVWRMKWRKWRMAYLAYTLLYSSGTFHCANWRSRFSNSDFRSSLVTSA